MGSDIQLINTSEVEARMITLRDQQVLIDRDVAALYGVETKRINEAVKNNPEKFPLGYVFSLQQPEYQQLVENFDRFETLKYSTSTHAFTERGLYMLATILKSPKATQTTLAIVESYAKVKELARNIEKIHNEEDNTKQKTLIERTGELLSDLLVDETELTETESTIELNLMAVKFKHTVRRKKASDNQ